MAFRSKYCQMLIKTERIDKEERLLMLWVPGSHYLVAIIFDRSNCPRSENFELKNSRKSATGTHQNIFEF